jgi:hypothetical protein
MAGACTVARNAESLPKGLDGVWGLWCAKRTSSAGRTRRRTARASSAASAAVTDSATTSMCAWVYTRRGMVSRVSSKRGK